MYLGQCTSGCKIPFVDGGGTIPGSDPESTKYFKLYDLVNVIRGAMENMRTSAIDSAVWEAQNYILVSEYEYNSAASDVKPYLTIGTSAELSRFQHGTEGQEILASDVPSVPWRPGRIILCAYTQGYSSEVYMWVGAYTCIANGGTPTMNKTWKCMRYK